MKEEYHTTRFKTPLLETEIPHTFYIITAWNPFGGRATETKNKNANAALLQKLQASGSQHFPITGFCEDHAEDGYGVVCEKSEAIQLGQEYRQDAIYEIKNDQVILVDCKGQEPDSVIGQWSNLLDS